MDRCRVLLLGVTVVQVDPAVMSLLTVLPGRGVHEPSHARVEQNGWVADSGATAAK